ncbi:MAG: hypothetical protein CFH42_02258 [Alphaproteobacteria bacterium MarineAlpha12_Bin1]|jgi:hypothetical protein|nr:MAG: hypothetical protein CFH42_02258 [Alphaproteobacteria bacterium MarineAlpha12_Bin1]|tara:strand:- start:1527 stop:1811 length:285 start_codon:yes stop_codon:yes gene_type:complete
MAMYRITKFTSSDMDKAQEISESMREVLEGVGADFIDIVSYGDGGGAVVAKYPNQEVMEAATETAKQAFGKMIEAGAIDGASIQVQSGEVLMSF